MGPESLQFKLFHPPSFSLQPLQTRNKQQRPESDGGRARAQPDLPGETAAAVCSLRPRRVRCSHVGLWASLNLQRLPGGRRRLAPEMSKAPTRSPLHPPVVALFAELLLEVAQGETVAVHGPPVRDLLAAEEIRHHGLGAARPVATEALFALLPAETSQRGREGRVRALAVPNQAKITRYNGNGRSELRFFRTALGSV